MFYKKDRKKKGLKENIDITKEEFIEYVLGLWTFKPENPKKNGHPAPFPEELAYRCIKLFSYKGDTVLDPFFGSATVPAVALKTNRNYIGVEIMPNWYDIGLNRCNKVKLELNENKS